MKFLFVGRNPSIFVQYERVVRRLVDHGHDVFFLLNSMSWRNAKMDVKIFAEYKAEHPDQFDFKQAVKPAGIGAAILRLTREILNYAAYIRDDNPVSVSPYMIDRAAQTIPKPFDMIARIRLVRNLFLKRSYGLKFLRAFERLVSPDKSVTDCIRRIKPDLLIASPFIFSRSEETEYVKCAKAIGIRTTAAIFSWDNLTSKGIFQVIPDSVLVWNNAQIEELSRIHKVCADCAVATGAPSLDFWFEQKPSMTAPDFLVAHGLPPDKPYILYLCSSQTIARNEHEFVAELIDLLQKEIGNRCPSIMIRPHPLNLRIWDDFKRDGVIIVPRDNRDIFYSKSARNLFFESFHYCSCVMGLNTTAMIEAAICDKPCMSVVDSRFSSTQENSGHFHHLSDAGILYTAHNISETPSLLKEVLDGDSKANCRRDFVAGFVRPCGIDQPAGRVTAEVLEELAKGTPVEDIKKKRGSV